MTRSELLFRKKHRIHNKILIDNDNYSLMSSDYNLFWKDQFLLPERTVKKEKEDEKEIMRAINFGSE